VKVLRYTRDTPKEVFKNGKLLKQASDIHRNDTSDEQDELEEEENEILCQGRFLEQDLSNSIKDAETAYTNDAFPDSKLRARHENEESYLPENSNFPVGSSCDCGSGYLSLYLLRCRCFDPTTTNLATAIPCSYP